MTPAKIRAEVTPLSYEPARAASSLDVGESFFREHIAPELKAVRRSGKVLYPVTELQAWLERNACRTLGGQ